MDGGKPGRPRLGRKDRPAPPIGVEVLAHDRGTRAVALQARSLHVLELEEFEEPRALARRCHDVQRALRAGQQQPGLGHIEEFDAPGGEEMEEVDDIEVTHQRVGQLDEGPDHMGLSG